MKFLRLGADKDLGGRRGPKVRGVAASMFGLGERARPAAGEKPLLGRK